MTKKITQREKLKRALEARGYREVQTASFRYVAMEKPGEERRFFLGEAGACRFGRVASKATAVLETTRQRLLKEGEALCSA